MKSAHSVGLLFGCFTFVLLSAPSRAAQDTSATAGAVTGHVSNAATGNLLEGAKIAIPQLGLTAFSDHTGRFLLSGVPPGTEQSPAQ